MFKVITVAARKQGVLEAGSSCKAGSISCLKLLTFLTESFMFKMMTVYARKQGVLEAGSSYKAGSISCLKLLTLLTESFICSSKFN